MNSPYLGIFFEYFAPEISKDVEVLDRAYPDAKIDFGVLHAKFGPARPV